MLEDLEKIKKGYVKFWRSFIEWEWYTDVSVKVLFIHCVLKANHKTKNWQGITVQRGSFITSRETLAFETGLSEMKIRTALKKLNLTGEITSKTTSRNTIITVNNYDLYQENNQQIIQQITSNQPAINQQVTTTNNEKNEKNIYSSSSSIEKKDFLNSDISDLNEERIKNVKNFYGEYGNVYLSPENYSKISTFVLNDTVLNELINDLSKEIASKSGKYLPYDEMFPDAHYLYLKRFWNYRRNKPVTEPKKSEGKMSNAAKFAEFLKKNGEL